MDFKFVSLAWRFVRQRLSPKNNFSFAVPDHMSHRTTQILRDVINNSLCANCGACLTSVIHGKCFMAPTPRGPEPSFTSDTEFDDRILEVCPGVGINYPELYRHHYGRLPEDARIGIVDRLWIGYAANQEIRRKGASGGIMTAVLIHLLNQKLVDAVILARQGLPSPSEASWYIARTPQEVMECAQSVYIPVSMLNALSFLLPGETYAITCVPEQSAALRVLQQQGNPQAIQIKYVLGPYTGTALEPDAITALLHLHHVKRNDKVVSLQWRAGEWPGYLEIIMESGKVIRSKKVYYNFLIPFYMTTTSLVSMDFGNEFTDLSVGDAWSPVYESKGQGFSVVVSRTPEMTHLLEEMGDQLYLETKDVLEASNMHGHMIDFKKRGGYLRRRWRQILGKPVPLISWVPSPISFSRKLTETVIICILTLTRTAPAKFLLTFMPESFMGFMFNKIRLFWKSISKPVKRKGLKNLTMIPKSHIP